ncbi:pantoate--beta-alanine ligase [Legionella spiritensis]|uniref:pantoate--beta-alanine ligase n=1 Tax=Legionella spiritensis TaxID=452 RepID=UPI000F6DFBF0|nr:pantoate--beta-alanine ligase [Legionella spiritensis]VEG91378.1 pantoate--beta-alanine ligase [Legionella spiritensis]
MRIFQNINEWQIVRHSLPADVTLGFVPTMGNLHAGHTSLLAASIRDNTRTAASIFINPTQFNRPDDFTHYPRTLDDDLHLLEKTGTDYCLLPREQDIYQDGYRYQVHENELTRIMEGQHRPGHFTGVLTIVLKLLNLTRPHQAYFGEKDYQQYLLIRDMAAAFFLPTSIKACPTIREASGLAYSSRNNRLNHAQRTRAESFARLFHQPHKSCEDLLAELQAAGIMVEYLTEQNGRRFVAVMIDEIRLIDNYALIESTPHHSVP